MKKPHILLVEDDPDNLALVKFILERAGYEILTAHDGIEGLEVAKAHHPDLILMDMTMPEMDGWATTELLKRDPDTQDITVVALTVRSLPEDRIRAMKAGCEGYITKPMDVGEFVAEVRAFVQHSQQTE
jgi:two-component system cell cycle response regulator DivK